MVICCVLLALRIPIIMQSTPLFYKSYWQIDADEDTIPSISEWWHEVPAGKDACPADIRV